MQIGLSESRSIRPLFSQMNHHLAIDAVLNGSAIGELYADRQEDPSLALVRTKYRLYLGGKKREVKPSEFANFFSNLKALALGNNERSFVLYCGDDLGAKVSDFLGKAYPASKKLQRSYFVYQAMGKTGKASVPSDYSLELVNESLIRKHHKNLRELLEEMCSERKSVEDFLSKSFGICAVNRTKGEMVGWCLSEYNLANRCEIGIETMPAYRRKGFAVANCKALIEYGVSKGVTQFGWHCYSDNVASVATAKKLGFKQEKDYEAYHLIS